MIAYKELALAFGGMAPDAATPAAVEAKVRKIRAAKLPDPKETGSAGSFFKNPVVAKLKARELITLHPSLVTYPLAGGRAKLAAGWLIAMPKRRSASGPNTPSFSSTGAAPRARMCSASRTR